jgi:hypothetical protein
MFKQSLIAVLVVMVGAPALAQSGPDLSPPPLVPAAPPPMPAPEPGTASPANPGTPPPPGAVQPPGYGAGGQPGYLPGPATGYQYSPYGAPPKEKPGPEVGLMITESLFGMLTAGSVIILPYLLFAATGLLSTEILGTVALIALCAAAPLAVAQAQVGIANGSAFWRAESWIPLITGILGEGLVFLTYYFANGRSFVPQDLLNPSYSVTGAPVSPAPTLYVLVMSSVAVPLLQMVAINLFKQPKFKPYALNYQPGEGFAFGLPTPAPILSQTATGTSLGMSVSVLNMRF